MRLFHIVELRDWAVAQRSGSYRPASLAAEGFVHFSFANQVAGTANRYYRELAHLVVIEVDPELVGSQLRIEDSTGSGTAFPHVYGPIPLDSVVAVHRLERDDAADYVFTLDA
jgi:uncharacterized protein (DUF952 family)